MIAASLAAALAALSGRPLWASVCLMLALCSKEEAVLLPCVLVSFVIIAGHYKTRPDKLRILTLLIGCSAALGLYAMLRHNSGAVTAATAPSYYRFTIGPPDVVRNALEYLDRAATFAAAVSLVAWLTLRNIRGRVSPRTSIVVAGLVWYVCGYAITTFLPVRSSLYACLPSLGPSMIAADYCSSLWQDAAPSGRNRALLAAIIVPLLLSPVYLLRNRRWTDLAVYSQGVLEQLNQDLRRAPANSWIVLVDRDRGKRVNVESAFGTLVEDALSLRAGHRLRVWVEPALSTAAMAGMQPPCESCPRLVRVISDGRVQPGDRP
jgi:hypothetical protein